MKSRKWILALILTLIGLPMALAFGQQVADPNFDPKVARPAYLNNHPKVLFDEAHFNFHTASGRYKAFADLITNDGYRLTANKEKFSAKTLGGREILVIANALGAAGQRNPEAGNAAFTEAECQAVREWVRAGGALLLIADHAPFGSAAENLAKQFGVEMSKGHTLDPEHHDQETNNASFLVFTREDKLLGAHPITEGRDAAERLKRVVTFTGQSLKGPEGSVAFLKLSETALDRQPPVGEAPGTPIDRLPDGQPLPPGARIRTSAVEAASAAGRAQGLALSFGQGRVVMLGEAAVLSAQVVEGAPAQLMGKEKVLMWMNRSDTDDRQLALNIMHWLSGLLR